MRRTGIFNVAFACLIFIGSSTLCHADDASAFDAIERYKPVKIEGWKVLVHEALYEETRITLREKTLKLLGDHLFRITTVVPQAAVEKLRAVPIWVEVAHPKHPCMCYHPGADWLRDNGMNPAKEGAVELSNCENFLDWTQKQPWMVLHELAHAYHHQFLKGGFENAEVLAAFQQAKQDKLYESILRIGGTKEKAYALNNQQEYFAEQTEALFGANDFYPFVSAELREYDPRMFELLKEIWGVK